MTWSLLALPGLLVWLIILLLPWRPWSTRESLDAGRETAAGAFPDITVLIPARNEAAVIEDTLQGLADQDTQLRILLLDDQSSDNTADRAGRSPLPNLTILNGQPLPSGWSGKLWVLEQGLQQVNTEYVLLLDADICLLPGTLAALRQKMDAEKLDLVSLMARLRMHTVWEKMLLPAFIFFFKLLYPFHLSNSSSPLVAAAAGGCILVRTDSLRGAQAFSGIRGELIDDCALARRIKDGGGRTWLGLTHSAVSLRPYEDLAEIRDMVARTAFTQLHYSWTLLGLCTLLMVTAFVLPVIALFSGILLVLCLSLLTFVIMTACYRPVIRFYALHPAWTLTLPVAGVLYLCITWLSAWRHLKHSGTRWKDRHYSMTAIK